MVEMAQKGEKADVVIMDPPRTGSDEAFLSSVVKLSPERVVYVSCGPETLARDLKYLTKHGYTVKRATPYDCFHLQATLKRFVVLLSKGAKAPVDLCSARTEVERTGLKVSSLYFAQIKKKCGLDVGENFNLPKSENARQPQCTPEKKEA